MDNIFLEHETNTAIWNALREHADKLERQWDSRDVWFRPMSYDVSSQDHEFLEMELDRDRQAHLSVKAVIMRYERNGKRVTAFGDELQYDVTVEIDDSLVGPQVSARVEGITTGPITQEVQ